MKKQEKLKKLFALAEQLGLSSDDIIKGVKNYHPINKSRLSEIVDKDIVLPS